MLISNSPQMWGPTAISMRTFMTLDESTQARGGMVEDMLYEYGDTQKIETKRCKVDKAHSS
jgi:hypothetical protein